MNFRSKSKAEGPVPAPNSTKDSSLAKAYWEVKSADGSLKRYTEVTDIIKAIMTQEITRDEECAHFGEMNQSGKRQKTKWEKVSKSLAMSSFPVRLLFEPIWAHTVRGAGLGAAVGIMFWLASGIHHSVVKEMNFNAGVVFAFFLISLSYYTVETIWRFKKEGFLTKVFYATFIVLIVIFSLRIGFVPTLRGVFFGFILRGVFFGFIGATLYSFAGALAGVFPGMILGTIVGLVREGNLCRAPTAQPESRMTLFIKGIILPSVLFICVVWTYTTFMSDKWFLW